MLEEEVRGIESVTVIGPLAFQQEHIRQTILHEILQWKLRYPCTDVRRFVDSVLDMLMS